jgi:glycosyltransferase involved in cell wall biosynthesis
MHVPSMGSPVSEPRLLAIMPVYNEEHRYLKPVLEHLINIVGRKNVFIYDDRSTDATFQIVSDMGLMGVQRGPETPSFTQHEGGFRQWGWNMFESLMHPEKGDWVLAIDADEMLYGTASLPALLHSPAEVLGITFCHMWDETHYRVDKAWKPMISTRLFRYREGGTFASKRLACGSEPDYVKQAVMSGMAHMNTPLVMKHLGYMDDADKNSKYIRYSVIDRGEFHSMKHIESIIDPEPILVPWTLS